MKRLLLLHLLMGLWGRPVHASQELVCPIAGEGCGVLSIRNVTLPTCPAASCRGLCGSADPVELGHCYCNTGCLYLGDCCPDYQQLCEEQQQQPPSQDHTDNFVARQRLMATVQCVTYGMSEDFLSPGILVKTVVQCHPDYRGDQHVKMLCENSTYSELALENHVLVYTPHEAIMFKNRYCAACHFINESQLVNTNTNFKCLDDEYVSSLFRVVEFHQFIAYVLQNCKIEHKFENMNFHFSRLSCPSPNPSSVHLPGMEGDLLYDICNSYSSYGQALHPLGFGMQYKNIHCAMASGGSVERFACPDAAIDKTPQMGQDWSDIPSFAVLMDFTQQGKVLYGRLPVCKSSDALDMKNEKCVQKICPPSTINVNGTCYRFDNTRVRAANLYENQIDMYIESPTPFDEQKFSYLRPSLDHTLRDNNFDRWNYSTQIVNCSDLSFKSVICKMVLKVTIGNVDASLGIGGLMMSDTLIRTANDIFPNMSQMVFLNYDVSRELECQGGSEAVWPEEPMMLTDSLRMEQYKQVQVEWRLNSTGNSYHADRAAVMVALSHDYVNDKEPHRYRPQYWTKSSRCAICDSNGFHACPKLAFAAHQYSLQELGGGTVTVTIEFDRMRKSFEVGAESVLVLEDGTLVVCEDWYMDGKVDVTLEQSIQTWLTIIGMALSIASLFFTIITLLLFPELRNVPGRIVLRLCISLLVAQFLFLTHHLYAFNAILCKLVASVEHYFWLVVFAWMNMFALNVSSHFISMYRFLSTFSSSVSTMRLYELVAWGIPLLIVLTCNVVEHVTHLLVYGDEATNTCWISPPRALLYVFVLPLAVVMFANMVCLIANIFIFLHFRQSIKQALDEKLKRNNHEMVMASVKLSLVMGFTWLSGFLANIPSLSDLWYLFILLNSTQGVFLLSAYGLNSRIVKLYKRLLRTGSRSDSSTQFTDSYQKSIRASASRDGVRK